ncbi:MAG TPA: dCTP deaminase [Polyangiaceae bacterium]|nr:dCTP deaminase [Polyangiaceae bacterium]
MILSDRDLEARIERGEIVIDPLDDPELQIQPASIDLRLGPKFVVYKLPHVPCIDARDPKSVTAYTEEIVISEGEAFVLQPGEFALGSTYERVRVPNDLVARVEGRSSIGRIAIVVHATAGFIDPGFDGEITLELSNLGRCAVKLYPGMRISQVVFHTMTSPAQRPYGPARGSKYQGQRGPVASRLGSDRETRKK